jgi:protoporphyrin/coproporphyrin ferrochelatase
MHFQKRAVILMNLGSPDSTEVKAVRKYLTQFLMDERVIDKPYVLRNILVKGIIVPFRAPKSAEAYRSVWADEGAPLIIISKAFQKEMQRNFEELVELVMRYGNPSSADVLKKLHEQNPELEEIILLPLYPHYAMSSYETAVEDIRQAHRKKKYATHLATIKPFYNNKDYLRALSESIKPYVEKDFDKILFSYHGLPERHIKKTDVTGCHCLKVNDCCHVPSPAHNFCYRHQTIFTTEAMTKALNIPPQKVEQTFQSRLGRDPWLTPFTATRLTELPNEGIKKLLVVCPAFVSDCLETLEEMAIQGKEIFLNAGGESFDLIPCLNTQPLWIQTVTGWLKNYMNGDKSMLLN